MQLVLPESFRKQALQGCHDDLGHLGIEWTIDLLRDHFYWPGMMENMTIHYHTMQEMLKMQGNT